MTGRLRSIIGEKISQYIQQNNVNFRLEVLPKKQLRDTFAATLQLPINAVEADTLQKALPELDFGVEHIESVRIQPAVGKNSADVATLELRLKPQAFVADVLQQGTASAVATDTSTRGHIVVEFSSPNIAKPFHVGHLRSTIIGNVIGNLHQQLGYNVTKLNYLGDWGTQFGLLQVGVEMDGVTDEQMRAQPIECLYRAYVRANTAAKEDASVAEKARNYFTLLESGTNVALAQQWQQYRAYTIDELTRVYARLGVRFDKYDWESQYSNENIASVLQQLTQQTLLHDEPDGRKVVLVEGRRVPVIKSDGSTLYLARDIAALLDRMQRYRFERIFYVVDNSQTDHFKACFQTTAALCKDELSLAQLKHIKFGRIRGMSTRSGTAVFLRDVLDEARDIMLQKQLQSPTTKVSLATTALDFNSVADTLGVSAVLINDLKQRRQRDYDFDWSKALQVNGDTGIKLQYTHCRLCSLLQTVADIDVAGVQPAAQQLTEPEAQDLLCEIARFDEAVWRATQQLEPCILVNYLFMLCNATSRAFKRLPVKHESHLAKQQNRVLLFRAAKETLCRGMQILGLNPLTKM